jgi:hypothetical protein
MTTPYHSMLHVPRWLRAFHSTAAVFAYIGGLVPLVWLAAFYSFIVRVRLESGFWPTMSGGPDRSSLAFHIHDSLIGSGIVALPLWFVSWFVAAAGLTLVDPTVFPLRSFFLLLLVWLCCAAVFIADPGSFFRWFFLHGD